MTPSIMTLSVTTFGTTTLSLIILKNVTLAINDSQQSNTQYTCRVAMMRLILQSIMFCDVMFSGLMLRVMAPFKYVFVGLMQIEKKETYVKCEKKLYLFLNLHFKNT
jgi:hypothetical protein